MIQFLLNQTLISVQAIDPNLTVLNYLRQHQHRCGSKEGCASGDCGACTVTLGRVEQGKMVYETANSCMTFVSNLQGKQLITVEDLKQGGQLHPVQQAMVDCHASQCGFCTPGFVMSLFTLQKNSRGWQHKDAEQALAGNLCRCTGYRPIVDAARQACEHSQQDIFQQQEALTVKRLMDLQNDQIQEISFNGHRCLLPKTTSQLVALLDEYPDAKLLAGGTDLALQVTQQYRTLPLIVALQQIDELKICQVNETEIVLGAGVSLQHCYRLLSEHIPPFAHILERFASLQIRNQGTLGGNIANGSPIGDTPPMLLALNATVALQKGSTVRRLPLADFFISYRQTALQEREFIRAIIIPKVTLSQNFQAWKVSKRREDDISAVFAAFLLETDSSGRVTEARVAFGGMAEIPKRATQCERQLLGKPLTTSSVEQACAALEQDFSPLSDFRASADYRLQVAKNLLRRYHASLTDGLNVLEVSRYVS
ncbi:xanthine dehydrogenase small subunit [Erwinia endophytica]|uniref:xanthine dehydrogenase small subunit n=1 Tax=Erwinia endophytica TaxID=1563158 RepID=UPI001265EEA0|nr:xanthine dehydrogenase small subunit [Erwinia endophytica]KAB8313581.1 xanthine dehydrogenase small subunit [Erwinia endophytica]